MCIQFIVLFSNKLNFEKTKNAESKSCDTIKGQFDEMLPWKKNAVRRELQNLQTSCYEAMYSKFEIDFIRRLRQKHLSLHIPKSGGSSFCKMMHEPELNFSLPRGNCWIEPFCPYWCCCSGGR